MHIKVIHAVVCGFVPDERNGRSIAFHKQSLLRLQAVFALASRAEECGALVRKLQLPRDIVSVAVGTGEVVGSELLVEHGRTYNNTCYKDGCKALVNGSFRICKSSCHIVALEDVVVPRVAYGAERAGTAAQCGLQLRHRETLLEHKVGTEVTIFFLCITARKQKC